MALLATLAFAPVLLVQSVYAQGAGTLKMTVTDPTAAVIPGATVHITGNGQTKDATTDALGQFSTPLPAGQYSVVVSATGFVAVTKQNVAVASGQSSPLDVALQIATATEKVDVNTEAAGAISVDPSANAGAIVLSTADLDALPDDPDDLEAQLTAMAGPAAGPNGAQIFIDGFSGGQMPPKSSIREIRINSNPFASEFDSPGFGRIQIFTKPGTDAYHASGFFILGDHNLDTRNPFVNGPMPNYSNKQEEFSLSGPLGKKISWFLTGQNRNFNTAQLVNAVQVDPKTFIASPYNQTFATPSKSWSTNPRVDYAINSNNTLVLRYQHTSGSNESGVGGFNLPTQEIFGVNKRNTVQATETMVIGTKSINEILFQFDDSRNNQNAAYTAGPTISVGSAFTTGGNSQNNFNRNRLYEFQEMNTITNGKHTMKFGARLRENQTDVQSNSNYNGTYSFGTPTNAATSNCFTGRFDPKLPAAPLDSNGNPIVTSLLDYQYTQQALADGYSMTTILANGCGPTSFSLSGGPSRFAVNQFDVGIFAQDDWRVKPNFTVSAGLRYEMQTNVGDKFDPAPRIAISWAPGGKAGKVSKTVLRLGTGMFYSRFPIGDVLNAIRNNGNGQLTYNVNQNTPQAGVDPNAALYYYHPDGGTTAVLPPSSLLTAAQQQTYHVDANLKSSYMIQTAGSIERALPGRTTLTVNVTDTRGIHDMVTRQINAFLPGTFNPATPRVPGVLPYPGQGNMFLYQDSGIYKELQVITSLNTRVNSHVSLNGYWAWTNYHAEGTPSNQYNSAFDYGRTGQPTNRFNLLGTVGLPWGWTASPSFTASTATPLNITIGNDYNGDGVGNDRPAFAPAGACNGLTNVNKDPNIKCTVYGDFNLAPGANYTPIPINYATGRSRWDTDLRLSRTWGWGERRNVAGATGGGGGGLGGPGGGGPGGGGGGPRGGGGGGPRGGGGGFGGGGRGGGIGTVGGGNSHRYNIGLTLAATDIFNHVNLSNPIGSLNSPFFGQSLNAISTGQGLGGGGVTGTRRIQITLRFTY